MIRPEPEDFYVQREIKPYNIVMEVVEPRQGHTLYLLPDYAEIRDFAQAHLAGRRCVNAQRDFLEGAVEAAGRAVTAFVLLSAENIGKLTDMKAIVGGIKSYPEKPILTPTIEIRYLDLGYGGESDWLSLTPAGGFKVHKGLSDMMRLRVEKGISLAEALKITEEPLIWWRPRGR